MCHSARTARRLKSVERGSKAPNPTQSVFDNVPKIEGIFSVRTMTPFKGIDVVGAEDLAQKAVERSVHEKPPGGEGRKDKGKKEIGDL